MLWKFIIKLLIASRNSARPLLVIGRIEKLTNQWDSVNKKMYMYAQIIVVFVKYYNG